MTVLVAGSSDDAEEDQSSGTVTLTSTDLEFTSDGSTVQTVAMRFDSLAIPRGARVTTAYIELTADETQPDVTNLTLYGEAVDNAATFTTASKNISSRTKTSAAVSWTNIPVWNVGVPYRTPDLSSLIQQVVNRPGWVTGNAMAFIVTGSGHRTAATFDGNSAAAPKLVIEYTTSP